MKRCIKNLISLCVFALVISSSFLFSSNDVEAQSCVVNNLFFSEITNQPPNAEPNDFGENVFIREAKTTLIIETSGDCSNGITIRPRGENKNYGRSDIRIDGLQRALVPNSDGIISLELELEEAACFGANNQGNINWGYECIISVQVLDFQGTLLFDSKSGTYNTPSDTYGAEIAPFLENGVILGNCTSFNCGIDHANQIDQENWDLVEVVDGSFLSSDNCTISADNISFSEVDSNNLSGQQVVLTVLTENCINVGLRLEIWEQDSLLELDPDNLVDIDLPDDPGSIDELYFTPIENQVVFNFRIRPDECDLGITPDCRYYIEIKTAQTPEWPITNPKIVSTENRFNGNWETNNSFTDLGEILGNCGNNCAQSPWELTQYPQGTLPLLKEIDEDNQEPIGINIVQNFDENNPCYENGSYREDCYELLAPLPESEDSFFQTDESTGRQFVITTDLQIGDYVNQFFKIALGILMVMAVIMIVIAGVEYMTVESIYGKSNARNRILGAVTGLILSLGIFLILDTINPRLLEVNFQAPEVNINIQQLASIGAADIDPTVTATLDANNVSYLEDSGVFCPKDGGTSNIQQIAESFEGKTTYRLGGKIVNVGSQNPGYAGNDATNTCPVETNTLCLDCSGFVSAVLYCAGITENGTINGGYGTSSIFSHSSALLIDNISNNNEVVINNQTRELQVGDLLGYSSNPYGHVGIYIGDGKVAEATSNANGRSTNSMIIIRNTTERQSYKKTLVPISEIITE